MPRIKELIDQVEQYRECLIKKNARGVVPHLDRAVGLYGRWKECDVSLQNHRAALNKLTKEYSRTKSAELIEESAKVKAEIKSLEEEARQLSGDISAVEIMLPNWFLDDVPVGVGDEHEKPVGYSGTPSVWVEFEDEFKSLYPGVRYETTSHKPLHHYDLVGTYIDQEVAGDVALSRFYYEFDEIVILDLALSMYAMEFFREKGYGDRLMIPPYLMRRSVEERITYFEAFEDTIFEIEKDGLLLVPSSEHPIVAYYEDSIFDEDELPLRVIAWSPCFRREAGTHGKDTRGIFRVRQFHKLELHSILRKDEDLAEIERMSRDVQEFLAALGLPNRAVVVPSGDMDKRALKQVDIQTWMPGQGRYRETHSLATLGSWVSEKLKLRYRVTKEKKELTRNVYATGVAVQRLICAIVENHYDPATNSVRVPGALGKYMMGVGEIPLGKKG